MKESYALTTGSPSEIGLKMEFYLAKKGLNLILTAGKETLLKTSQKTFH